MSVRLGSGILTATAVVLAAASGAAAADPLLHNMADMKFGAFPGFPTCTSGSFQLGDPATQPTVVLVKIGKGCSIPWHWHTPNENVMLMSGQLRLEVKDEGGPRLLKAGGFAQMPAKHVHRAQCMSKGCLVYIYADAAPFDIHYVDAQGNEIAPAEALTAVHEATSEPAGK